jgi:uncharacterized protein YjdB
MNKKITLFITLFLGLFINADAQCPPNIDFESGLTTDWQYFTGTVATGPIYTMSPSGPTTNYHTLTTGTGLDAYGGFPIVGTGVHSIQVLNEVTGSRASRARYYIQVPIGGTYSFIYRYAVVLNYPGTGSHTIAQMPTFVMNASDSLTGAPVACAQYNYVAGPVAGFTLSALTAPSDGTAVYYKPWTTGNLKLSGLGGSTIQLDVLAAGCSPGAHFGYGYFDMSCGLYATLVAGCGTSTTLTGPDGYVSYSWSDSATFTIPYGTTQTVVVPTPTVTTTYAVILTPVSGFGCTDTLYTTVTPSLVVPPITGPTSVCVNDSISLADATAGGTWSSSNFSVAGVTALGRVWGASAGTAIISYSVIGPCSTITVTYPVTVNAQPAALSPGSAVVCVGSATTLTDATSGGVWSASNSTATVAGGIVTGVSAGIDIISYTIGTCAVTALVTVNATPAAISPGSATVCLGSTVLLTDVTTGGAWSVTNSHASISGGTVTGISSGVDTIRYTKNGCFSLATVTVATAVAAILPSTATICTGSSLLMTDAISGGTWSATNTNATFSGGNVSGATAGLDTIIYSIGTCVSKAYITINPLPAAITPSGPISICLSTTATLADGTPSGSWSSVSGSVATVSAGGIVTGVGAGNTIISYTHAGCASTKTVTVLAAPAAISPATSSVCVSSNVTLTDATAGGIWGVGNANATVVGGVVTGVSAGTVTISYFIGTCFTTAAVTVNALPAAITPSSAVTMCVGASATLSDVTPLGIWSSGAPGTAPVTSGGVLTGLSAGTATISYTNGLGCSATKNVTVVVGPTAISPTGSSVCIGKIVNFTDAVAGGIWTLSNANATNTGSSITGVTVGVDTITYAIGTCFTTATVTINSNPAAITPSTPVSVCVGGTASLSDLTPGGIWISGASGTATVSLSGLVTGVAPGTVNISYANSFGCAASKAITVNITPSAIFPASSSVCVGNTVTLTNAVSGGVWTSSAPAVATVSAGVVTGVGPGTATITYAIGTCQVTATITVNPSTSAGTITGPSIVCVGSSMTLADGTSGGVWSSATPGIATVSGTGLVTGVSGGIATISYTVSSTCGTVAATTTVNVIPTGVLPITGPSLLCAGTFANLTDATTGGTWSASNASATVSSPGLLTGVTPGTDTITYTVVNVCGTSSTTKIITVGAFLTAGTILGGNSLCVGASITLTDLAPGGVWGATNANALVTGGVVTGVTAGVDTITFTVSSSCGSAIAMHPVTVNPLPLAGAIAGPSSVCIGSSVAYTDAIFGGTWSMTNSRATISVAGLLTPVAIGLDTIRYSTINSCGSAATTLIISIGAIVTAGTISGPTVVCAGSAITLTDATTGGAWSVSNAATMVGSTGIVTGLAAGVDTVSYTVSASCGSASATHVVTVNPMPDAGSISGPTMICLGSPVTYIDGTTGGTWSMSNSLATISGTGILTPAATGADTVRYAVSNGCGTVVAIKAISIGGTLSAGIISGSATVCIGSSITLTDATPGGAWSASNGHATIGSTGIVNGISAGADTISYSFVTSCGTIAATYVVTVTLSSPTGVISGPSGVCSGGVMTLTESLPGGTWSSSNIRATISALGVVNGITPGLDTITYTVSGACGIAATSKIISIDVLPIIGAISGATGICVGTSVPFIDATPGGIWSMLNANATIGSASGMVTGVTAGSDVINYTVANACGTVATTSAIIINPLPDAGAITGPTDVCSGFIILLSDVVPGGTWSAGNANASVSSTGIVTGLGLGTVPISYSVANSCGSATAISIITVSSVTSAGFISGISNVCIGSGITLTNPVAGGVWSATNGSAVISGPGIVGGVSIGVDTILYTVTGGCGTSIARKVVSVNPVPVVAAIIGPTTQCTGSTIMLANATAGGQWTSSAPAIAPIGLLSGIVTGTSAGMATLTYMVTNSFGCPTTVISRDTVSVAPVIPAIIGPANVCIGGTVTLSNLVTGGSWSSATPSVATINPVTGVMTTVSAGTTNISYTVVTACGAAIVSRAEAVNPLPVVAAITGTANECVGATATLTNPTPGGVWSSSNIAIASIGSSSGIVTGLGVGTVSINYTVSSPFGCTSMATIMNTVNAAPVVAAIAGTTHQCVGSASTLGDATPGGAWSSSDVTVATVSVTGLTSGIAPGVATIFYSVSTAGCTATVIVADTVNMNPVHGVITGITNICAGATTALADVVGGFWSSAQLLIATISPAGIATGVSPGNDEIYYTISNGCGTVVDSIMIMIGAGGTAGTITGPTGVCQGALVTLTNGIGGGLWSSSNARATIGSATGIVTGITTGTDTIKYTVAGACGSALATRAISINGAANAGIISGFTSVCEGSAIILTESMPGGSWSSSNAAKATVSGGSVTGIAAGSVTISYSVTNGCGTRSATHGVSVAPASVCRTMVNTAGAVGQEIFVYPNPATNMLRIDAAVKVDVSILSIDGKLVLRQKDATIIDISQLPDAMYMVVICDEQGLMLKTAKFAKIK